MTRYGVYERNSVQKAAREVLDCGLFRLYNNFFGSEPAGYHSDIFDVSRLAFLPKAAESTMHCDVLNGEE
jgi:hypothetical protein